MTSRQQTVSPFQQTADIAHGGFGKPKWLGVEALIRLQDDLILGFGSERFQFDLTALEDTYYQDSKEFLGERTKLFLTVQNDICERYGFGRGTGGVIRMVAALHHPDVHMDPKYWELKDRLSEGAAMIAVLTHMDVSDAHEKQEFMTQNFMTENPDNLPLAETQPTALSDPGVAGVMDEANTRTVEEGTDQEQETDDANDAETSKPTSAFLPIRVEEAIHVEMKDLEPEADVSWLGADVSWPGPRANFRLFKEILPMPLEREEMTPAEITDMWEKAWGVHFASRIRFLAPDESAGKYLNAREDFVPLHPSVVELEAKNGSILYALATSLKEHCGLKAASSSEPAQAEPVARRSLASRARKGPMRGR